MDANCSQRIQFLGDSSVPASLANLYFFATVSASQTMAVLALLPPPTVGRPAALPGDALRRRTRESGRCSIRALRQQPPHISSQGEPLWMLTGEPR